MPSGAIRCHQVSSGVIRCHQVSSLTFPQDYRVSHAQRTDGPRLIAAQMDSPQRQFHSEPGGTPAMRRHRTQSVAISRHQSPSDAITRHETPSNAIRGHQSVPQRGTPSNSNPIKPPQRPSHAITRHHTPSHAIRRHQTPSDAIKPPQRPSHAITRHQTPSDAIRCHQTPSKDITRRQTLSEAHPTIARTELPLAATTEPNGMNDEPSPNAASASSWASSSTSA